MNRHAPRVKIIFGNGFPRGGAAARRCLHIAKGLQANGISVEVLIFRGTEREGKVENIELQEVYEGIPFRYIPGSLVWPTGIFRRAYNYYMGLFSTFRTLVQERRTSPVDALILAGYYGHLPGWLVTRFCRKLAIPSTIFADEYPDFLLKPKSRLLFVQSFLSSLVTRRFTVMAVISKALYDYWQPVIGTRVNVIHYPLTAETPDNISEKSPFDFNYLFYSGFSRMRLGSGFLEKDEPDVLLKAFSLVVEKYSDLKLVITGEKNDSLVELVRTLGIEDQVIFAGKVGKNEYFSMIHHAAACIIPRPKTLQTKGSIPYRLGEYLLSGGYVISSDVGEIREIVGDNEGIVFYTPGKVEDLAGKIRSVLSEVKEGGIHFNRLTLRIKFDPATCAIELAQLIKNSTSLTQTE